MQWSICLWPCCCCCEHWPPRWHWMSLLAYSSWQLHRLEFVSVLLFLVWFFFFLQIFSSQAVNVALKWTSLYPSFCPSNLVVADTKAAAFNLLSGTQKLVTGCIYFLQNKCIATGENYVAHWATVPLHKILKVCKYSNTFRIAFPTLVLV